MSSTAVSMLAVLSLCACAGAQPPAPAAAQAASPLPPAALFERGIELARAGDAVRAEQYLLLAQRAGYPARASARPRSNSAAGGSGRGAWAAAGAAGWVPAQAHSTRTTSQGRARRFMV